MTRQEASIWAAFWSSAPLMMLNSAVAPRSGRFASASLRGLDLPPLGNYEKSGGPLLTKTLLFIGQGIESNTLRAFDKDTGYEVFEMALPARSSAAPITYLAAGTQFIVLAIGGGDVTEQLIALALP